MSDSESSQGFQLDDSGSEGYVETTQARKTQKKPAAPKAAKVSDCPGRKPASLKPIGARQETRRKEGTPCSKEKCAQRFHLGDRWR
jgi:hypothetical protein